jgi:hypothetical protein
MRRPGPALLVPLLLLGLTWAVYAPVRSFGFVDFDDPDVVVHNPHVNAGLTPADVRWAVTGFAVGHWEPLTWWSLQADATAWHLRPGPMHVENVLLHALGSWLLFALLVAMTGAAGRSAVVAALFAVHPMHVESVAWITERRDVLSTPLLLASLWAYARYARAVDRRWAWYAAFLGLYVLSLSAKATGMTMPVALLLLDHWPLRRTGWWRLMVEKVPVAVPAVATAILAAAAQRAVGATSTLADLGVVDRLANAVVTTVLYVAKLAVPTGLSVIYPHPGGRPPAAIAAAAGLLALVTAVAWRQRRRRPYLLVGWAWFLVTLSPTNGLFQSGPQAMADRYSYVPSIGLLVAVVWSMADAAGRAVDVGLSVVVIAAAAVVAHAQVGFWRDTETLFTRANDVTGGSPSADLTLGNLALSRGDVDRAATFYQRTIAASPAEAKAYASLSYCYQRLGDPVAAEQTSARAVALRPHVAAYHVRHALALALLPHDRDAAISECRAALSLDPANADARAGLADLLARPPDPEPR